MSTQSLSIDNFLTALASSNLEFEATTNIESRDTFVGIRGSKKFTWDWFEGHTYYSTEGTSLRFNHTFSQNSGKVRKSLMHRIRTEDKYRNLLGVEVTFNH